MESKLTEERETEIEAAEKTKIETFSDLQVVNYGAQRSVPWPPLFTNFINHFDERTKRAGCNSGAAVELPHNSARDPVRS